MLNIHVGVATEPIRLPAKQGEVETTTSYILMVENPLGHLVGCFQYDNEIIAEAAFNATIGAKVCLYKQDCMTKLIKCA